MPAATLTPSRPPAVAAELAADTALLNAKVITIDPQDSIAQAVAVKDGLIQAVGRISPLGDFSYALGGCFFTGKSADSLLLLSLSTLSQ